MGIWDFVDAVEAIHMSDEYAVVEVMSTAISIFVVLTIISAIMFWGGPYVEDMKSKAVDETIYDKMSAVIENIRDITHETAGSRRSFTFDVTEGMMDIDNVGDRFVVMYSLDENYNFTVTGLDDDDETFEIEMIGESSSGSGGIGVGPPPLLSYVDVYWFPDDPIIIFSACEDVSLADLAGHTCSYLKFDITPVYEMEEHIKIMSVKLRLTASKDVNIVDGLSTDVGFSRIDDQLWKESWSCSSLSNLPVSQHTVDGAFFSFPNYIESSNILNVFLADYESQNQFCSFRIENSGYLLDHPILSMDRTLRFDGIFDPFSSFPYDADLFTPELIVNYIELPPDSSTGLNSDDQSKRDTDSDAKGVAGYSADTENHQVTIYRPHAETDGSLDDSIKTAIIPQNTVLGGISYDYGFEGGSYTALFRRFSSETLTNSVAVAKEGYAITYTPGDYLYYLSDGSPQSFETSIAKSTSAAQVDGNTLTYIGQYGPGFDLQYTALSSELKEELVIADASLIPEPPSDDASLALLHHIEAFDIDTGESMGIQYGKNREILKRFNSFETIQITGSEPVYFTDRHDRTVFCLPELYAWDSASPESQIRLERTIQVDSRGSISVWIQTPWRWLSDSSRVYPIYVDDTTQLYSAKSPGFYAGYYLEGNFPPDIAPDLEYYQPYDSTQIKRIHTDDDIKNLWGAQGTEEDHVTLLYRFFIEEGLPEYTDYIRSITVKWNGHDEEGWNLSGDDFYLYIWDHAGLLWDEKTSEEAREGDVDLRFTIESDFDKYLGGHGQLDILYLGGTASASVESTYEDYVEVNVVSNFPPYEPYDPLPDNGTENVPLNPTLSTIVEDPDNDFMNAEFFFKEGALFESIQSFTGVPSGSRVETAHLAEAGLLGHNLSEETTYEWYVEVTDSEHPTIQVQSDVWSFTTIGDINFSFVFPSPPHRNVTRNSTVTLAWERDPTSPPLTYQYKLDGYVDAWSSWTTETRRTYYNLPGGEYTFWVTGKDIENPDDQITIWVTFVVASGYEQRQGELDNNGSYIFSCDQPLKGTIRIDLYDDLNDDIIYNDVLFGRVYLFDLGLIEHTYSSMIGTDITVVENNGLLDIKSGSESMEVAPGIIIDDNLFTLRIVQMKQLDDFYAGGSGTLRFTATLLENYIREMLTDVFNVKLQVYGRYADIWLDYLEETLGFDELSDDPTGHTLLSPLGGDRDTVVNYQPMGGESADPKAEQLGGLFAFEGGGIINVDEPFIFQDLNSDWNYNLSEPIINPDPDDDGIDADPDGGEPGGLLGYDWDGEEPYTFQDLEVPKWMYTAGEFLHGDPDQNGMEIFFDDVEDDDVYGGLYALDDPASHDPEGSEPYTFKDINGDWIFGARLTIIQSFCKVGFG